MTPSEFEAARGVLRRVLGSDSALFEFDGLTEGEFDVAEVSAESGRVRVLGNSPVALCRGAYHYLRECGLGMMAWSGERICLPSPLPSCAPTRIESQVLRRHYLSVCTYGYSAVWWDWPRWEEELDWMALHGINQPLLLAGQEAVSRRVFRQLGLTEEEIAAHFSGPAYLCWHRLGNLNGYKGPLPRSWIDGQERLQRRILDRARGLGMRPIVPGFSGFAPAALARARSDVALMSAEPWAGFPATTYIDPRSEVFREAGRLYMQDYRRTYGPVHDYLCEIFAEQAPCLNVETDLDDLRAIGGAIWGTLCSADADAKWVMQGWPFYFARDYWTPERAEALLHAAPAGRVTVLDLATEELETWRRQPVMREKGWMFNVVHNYGQNTHLHGDLRGFVDRAEAVRRDPSRGRLQGFGISPEGIDQNPVVYELLTDLPWAKEGLDVSDWVRRYAAARYGRVCHGAEKAWEILAKTVYGPERSPHPRYSWRFRPGDQPLVGSPDIASVREALDALLGASDVLLSHRSRRPASHGSEQSEAPPLAALVIQSEAKDPSEPIAHANFRRDVVDVAKTWLGAICDRLLEQALEGGDREPFFSALSDLDVLLATRPEHRLSTWLEAARSWASNPSEARLFERNARSLVTHWGGPFLFDYATREWAGLISGFHALRWRRWNDGGPAFDFAAWEREWAQSSLPPEEGPPADEIATARRMVAKYGGVKWPPDPELTVHRLEPQPCRDGVLCVDLGEPKVLTAAACCPIFGQGMLAHYALELSPDGRRWEPVPAYCGAQKTFRGMRFRFEAQPVRYLTFTIEIIQGSPEQMFQVVLFELS